MPWDCKKPRTESSYKSGGGLKQIQTNDHDHDIIHSSLQLMFGISSCPPLMSVIDTGADIIILGGNLFKTVATTAKLKKRDFCLADKTHRNYIYNQQLFQLDGCLDLGYQFWGTHHMCTPVYMKMDAHNAAVINS